MHKETERHSQARVTLLPAGEQGRESGKLRTAMSTVTVNSGQRTPKLRPTPRPPPQFGGIKGTECPVQRHKEGDELL